MKISTKARYALRLLIDLAANQQERFVPLSEVAQRQEISKKYLEQIVHLLGNSGLLITNRGSLGGYRLSRSPQDISLGEILRITEGHMAIVPCVHNPEKCPRAHCCQACRVWNNFSASIESFANKITLADML